MRWRACGGSRAALALMSALALAAGACASDDDGGAAARGAADVALGPDPAVNGGDRAQIREVLSDVQEGLVAGSGISVCNELTTDAKRAVSRSRAGGPPSCPLVVEAALERLRDAGKQPVISEMREIRIDGDEAVVSLSDDDRGDYDVLVVLHDRWALPALDLDRPSGLRPLE